jgi:tripartite-type tricarboxylate transporter receptor subunit TctC
MGWRFGFRSIQKVVAMKRVGLLLVFSGLFWMHGPWAQTYPIKPIKLIVPYAAGGGSDFVARLVGVKLTEALEQSVIIENRPGAGGLIGAELVARAPADGYTLLLADASFTISPVVNKKPSYSAIDSFSPIALVADTPYVFIAPAESPASNLLEYVNLARAQPNKISIGSAGNGSGSHLAGELFQLGANLHLIHIPYKSSGQVTMDTMSGQVQSSFATAPSVVQNYKSGKLKILAAASAKRSAALPDVPTFAELGFKQVVITNWYGVLAPSGTASQIIGRISKELAQIVQQSDVRERLSDAALEPMFLTPRSFSEHIAAELSKWEFVVREAKIQID